MRQQIVTRKKSYYQRILPMDSLPPVQNFRAPKFCMSPKIQKYNNPGYPVISSVECHTWNISRYVDYKIPLYVKGTNDLIK